MPDEHQLMPIGRARLIALGSETGRLGEPTKMPGPSFGISATHCIRGKVLAADPTSVCAHCYALTNYYLTKDEVLIAHKRRFAGLTHPEWVPAMVALILHETTNEFGKYFRWHDSGDLQGIWHLLNIVKVCIETPRVRHWLPTHEPNMVADYLKLVHYGVHPAFPENLCLRISADYIGKPPKKIAGLEMIPTHTAHRGHGKQYRVKVSDRLGDSFECDSYTRAKKKGTAGFCGDCRACWNNRIKNVSFPVHGEKWDKYQLRLFPLSPTR